MASADAASASAAAASAAAADAELVDKGVSAADLSGQPLWLNGTPKWAQDQWSQLKQALLKDNQDWNVWTDWYRDRLEGLPAIGALELARVMIADEIWNKGPRAVNAEIARLIKKYSPPKPLANIPSALGFGWTDNGTMILVSSPANWPVFPLPTNERDHRNRLDACRTLAKDIRTQLRAKRYNVRGEYAAALSKYVSRLPDAPGTVNILLADAETRTLRNLFEADAQTLSLGFASQLKTFLEQHYGLRPYYPAIEEFYRDVQRGRIQPPLPDDAVEGFVKGVKDNTPSIFDPSVTNAIDASAQPAPAIEPPPPDRAPPADPTQPGAARR